MQRSLVVLIGMFLLLMIGTANAALTTIGTATYNGSDYDLIWDDNNNGNSVVWLDYTNAGTNWTAQNAWAGGLESALIVNLAAAYSVDWGTNSWRLPSTVDGAFVQGFDGTTTGGFSITNSEMGHLFYEELGNLGQYGTDGTTQSGSGLNNTGDFDNLVASWYWSGMEYALGSSRAWNFYMNYGYQDHNLKSSNIYGLAVRTAQVTSNPVPIPGAILLFGSGLIGLIGLRRKC